MSHTNTRIYIDTGTDPDTGVSIEDIRQVLRVDRTDVGGLVTEGVSQGRINKWAKFKPIHFPGNFRLAEADFRGRPIDTNDANVVYGLEVPAQIAVLYPPDSFHDVTWDYLGYPNATGLSGTSMYRMLDFDGYDSTAKADLSGTIPAEAEFYARPESTDADFSIRSSEVDVGYHKDILSSAVYPGVELARYAVDGVSLSDQDLMARLCDCYPAILIGDQTGTNQKYYITALTNIDHPSRRTVVYNSGTIVSPNYVRNGYRWGVDFTKTDEHGNAPAWTATYPCQTKATLVLAYFGAGSDPYVVAGDSTTSIVANWVDVSEERATTARLFPLPGACGIPITLKSTYTEGVIVTPSSVSYSNQEVTITSDVQWSSGQSQLGGYILNATIGADSCTKGSSSAPLPITRTATTVSVTLTCGEGGDFSNIAMFMPNTTYEILVDVTATPGNNNRVRTFTFTA